MKKLILLTTVLICCKAVTGQDNTSSGYIIKNNQDTISGQIKLSTNVNTHLSCFFRTDSAAEFSKYEPNDIAAYRINDEKLFVTKTVTINEQQQTFFLEFMVKGIVNLYYLNLDNKEVFFIEKEGVLHALTNDEVEKIDEDGNRKVVNTKKYIGVLTYYYRDAPQLKPIIDDTEFDHKSLINITKKYHNTVCNDYKCIDYTKSFKPNLMLEPFAGYVYTKMDMYYSSESSASNSFIVGADLFIQPATYFKLWQIRIGLSYSHTSNQGIYNIDFNNRNADYDVTINRSLIRLPIGFEVTAPTKKVKPFIGAALQTAYCFNYDYSFKRIIGGYDPESTLDYNYIEMPVTVEKFSIGYLATIGAKIITEKRYIKFGVSYERIEAMGLNPDINSLINPKTILVNFGYGFSLN